MEFVLVLLFILIMCDNSKLNQYTEKIPEKMFKLRTPDRVRVDYVDCEEYSQGRWWILKHPKHTVQHSNLTHIYSSIIVMSDKKKNSLTWLLW